jgi:hypothetical protein
MRSSSWQLAVTAVVASSVSIGGLLLYQDLSRRQLNKKLKEEVQKRFARVDSDAEVHPPKIISRDTGDEPSFEFEANEDIIREQLARNYAFFGEDGMQRIRNSRVVVVGCGGVGSWASVMLVRSYVPYLIPLSAF